MLSAKVTTPSGTTYTVSATGLPPGASANPQSLNLLGGTNGTTSLMVSTGSAAKGAYQVKLVLSANGTTHQTVPIALTIK